MRQGPPLRLVLRRFLRLALPALVCAVPWAASPAGATISTFAASNEGWVVVNYPFHSHVAAPQTQVLSFDALSGLAPGSVRVADVFAETGIAAPAAFLGDRSASYGGAISYDILIRYSDLVPYPAVVLNGGTLSLYYDAPAPPLNEWAHRVVPLTEAGWSVSGSGVPATQAQLQAVLQNLVGLYLYTEWHSGPDDTNVDNVFMTGGTTAVPPAAPAAEDAMKASPNPFTSSTTLSFVAPRDGPADLEIVSVSGRVVRRLAVPAGTAGARTMVWDGRDGNGERVAPGIYYGVAGSAGARSVVRIAVLR